MQLYFRDKYTLRSKKKEKLNNKNKYPVQYKLHKKL
jgi:hypothetical protein